jgi:hypothetical protein
MVVDFPVDHGPGIRSETEVSCWEKVSLAAFLQKYWASNQVSCTVTFNPETEANQIEPILNYFQYQLKGISFLPLNSAYKQMSYEAITSSEYLEMSSKLKPIIWTSKVDAVSEKFCDSDVCTI